MREKLIEFIRKADKEDYESRTQDEHYAYMADHLIANGVTIQKWIPVSERLPEQYKSVIGWTEYREIGEVYYDGKKFEWVTDEDTAFVTHWMPLPEPPKGE